MIIWTAFVLGVFSNIHCVGMCGPIVLATGIEKSQNFIYQLGRLLGYLAGSTITYHFGNMFFIQRDNKYLATIPAILLGAFLIFWGLKQTKAVSKNRFFDRLEKVISPGWKYIFKIRSKSLKSFLTGLITFLLPCGLLYGLFFALVAIESITLAYGTVFAFWIATVPATIIAPEIIKKVLLPIKLKFPRLISILLIGTGTLTITMRILQIYEETIKSCH